ncbi:hypothetical protein AB0950_36690 [Streptomyces sp. NPDC007189]|uniref:hypothetical protein n=1 Tax=Streptomyces sp. NPDC007189 TaxID=3154315 RepID=UPI003453248F
MCEEASQRGRNGTGGFRREQRPTARAVVKVACGMCGRRYSRSTDGDAELG